MPPIVHLIPGCGDQETPGTCALHVLLRSGRTANSTPIQADCGHSSQSAVWMGRIVSYRRHIARKHALLGWGRVAKNSMVRAHAGELPCSGGKVYCTWGWLVVLARCGTRGRAGLPLPPELTSRRWSRFSSSALNVLSFSLPKISAERLTVHPRYWTHGGRVRGRMS